MARLRVVVQAGHVAPREPGFESGTGTVREQEFTKKMADTLVKMLDDDSRFDGVYVPGDIPNGIKCDAFISEHGDGSANTATRGFCFGYPTHAVNKRLADLIADEYLKLPGHPPRRRDNYTSNLSGYYGYSRVNTSGPEVLVESGFLTSPVDRGWMFENIDEMCAAQYRALLRHFNLSLPTSDTWKPGDPVWLNLPGPKPKPQWFWDAQKEIDRRRALSQDTAGTPIVGTTKATVKQVMDWALGRGAVEWYVRLVDDYYTLAAKHGKVRPDLAFVQSCKETGFGHFGGVLNATFKNPCGMKTTGGGGNQDPAAHQRFDTWADGISAHLDHLALYAGAAGYPRAQTTDPRHFPSILGTARTFEELGGKWAPAGDYGETIVRMAVFS